MAKARSADDVVRIELDEEVVPEFVQESIEQLAETDGNLMSLESDPADEEALGGVFRCFHTIKGLAGFLGFEQIENLAHAAEDLLDQAKVIPLDGPTIDGVFDASDMLKLIIEEVRDAMSIGFWTPTDPERTVSLTEQIRLALVERDQGVDQDPGDGAGANADAEPEPGADDAPTPVVEPDASANSRTSTRPRPGANNAHESIRVDGGRLDRLLDLIGELVITESMLGRVAEMGGTNKDENSDWQDQLSRMGKLSREIHELAGSLRMIPVRATFRKMTRLTHDVAKKADKSVNFQLSGEETEMDKSLVDRLGDPLVHLIRNAIDHGLEDDPADRLAAGKPEQGRVDLRAYHREGNIFIEIADDGAGMDRESILAKARERGVIRDTDTPSDREILRLICEPGFSMAPAITEISGRGVGMDVVKRGIEDMGGKLEISSEIGKGSTFTLQLPLTLAVIDGMVLQSGGERFIIPTLSVVRLVTPSSSEMFTLRQRDEVIKVHDEPIPVVRLDRLFASEDTDRPATMAVIAEADDMKIALMIDEVLDQQQVVIKSMDERAKAPGLSGCAIMPDGEVGLVLDPNGLVRLARRHYPSATDKELAVV
jgi:two-component system chemotaxis sensor kinase CheA